MNEAKLYINDEKTKILIPESIKGIIKNFHSKEYRDSVSEMIMNGVLQVNQEELCAIVAVLNECDKY